MQKRIVNPNERDLIIHFIPESGVLEDFNRAISHIIPLICSGLLQEKVQNINDALLQEIEDYLSDRYPALNQSINTIVNHYVFGIQTILVRLNQDKSEVFSTFGIDKNSTLSRIRLGILSFAAFCTNKS